MDRSVEVMGARHRLRLLVVAGACAAVLMLPASGDGAGISNCTAAQMNMRVVSFEGARGHRFWQLAFRNLGATCSLRGFSRVVLLARNGRSITEGFRRETGFPQRTVVLERGKSAFVAFTYVAGGFCTTGQIRAFRVRIFLPGAAGRFLLDPLRRNNGSPIFLCAGSERIYPVTPEPGP
jgi:hypothetical protein